MRPDLARPPARPPRSARRRGWPAAAVLAVLGACSAAPVAPEISLAAIALADATPPPPPPGRPPRLDLARPRIRFAGGDARLRAAFDGDLPAALRLRAIVDRQAAGEKVYAFQGQWAALVSRGAREQRYCAQAVSVVDERVAAEEARIARGARPEVAADSYLYVGEVVGDVAIVYDWCFDQTSPAQRRRWLAYANQAVSNVWAPREASWGGKAQPWAGWSVENPANNYYASFLEATLLLGLAAHGDDPAGDRWVRAFRDKLRDDLFPTFGRALAGGGSQEGTGYGTAMRRIFRLYEVWESSTGERVATLTPHTRQSLLYLLHATVPTLDRLAPIGDHARDATAVLFDTHRDYVQVLSFLLRDDPISGFGPFFLRRSSVREAEHEFSVFGEVLYARPDAPERPLSDLATAYFAPGPGHLFLRSDWGRKATWVGLIAGPYSESHAHRDQGSLLLYKGEWLVWDQNVASRSGLLQGEDAHSLVRIARDGTPLRMGRGRAARLVALSDEPDLAHATVDVTPMYGGVPGVSRVERQLLFVKPDVLVVLDRVDAGPGADRIWQLNTPWKPRVASDGVVTLKSARSSLTVRTVSPRGARPAVVDWRAVDRNMRGGWRVDVPAPRDGPGVFLTVLAVDDAVKRVREVGAPGGHGVELGLRDGRTVIAQFPEQGGVDVETRSGGRILRQGPLPAGVAPLPELARR